MKTKKLGGILLTILVFSLMAFSCQPIVTEPVDNTTPPPPVEPVQGDKPGRASAQFMNIVINGDEIQTKVAANYPAIASFYGDGGAMLEGLAVANLYPPREANPDFPFSLKNNMISYMPERSTLKNFQIQGTKPAQSEIAAFCAITENRISTLQPESAALEIAMGQASDSFSTNVNGDISNLPKALSTYGYDKSSNDDFIDSLDGISNLFTLAGSIAATPFLKFIPGIGEVAQVLVFIGQVGKFIAGIFDLTNPQPNEIEVAITDLYNKMAAMDARLTTLENNITDLNNRFVKANAVTSQQNFQLVRDQLNTWRALLNQKMYIFQQSHSSSDLDAFVMTASAIDADITSTINNYITLAISAHDAYLAYLTDLSSPSGSYATDKATYLDKWSLGMKTFVNETINKKVYSSNTYTGDDNSTSRTGWFTFGDIANVISNPNKMLPFSNEIMDFLYEIILFRFNLVDIIHEKPTSQEAMKSYYAKELLNTSGKYIQQIRQELNTGYSAVTADLNTLLARIDAYQTECQNKLTHDLWQNPTISGTVTYGEIAGEDHPRRPAYATYGYNNYSIQSLTYQRYNGTIAQKAYYDVFIGNFTPNYEVPFPTSATANLLKTGIPEQTVTDINTPYTGKIITGVTRTFGNVELTINGTSAPLTVQYGDPQFWTKLKDAVKLVYMSRSAEMLNFAARLASLEMLLETYVCD